jgi:hypothetical protein
METWEVLALSYEYCQTLEMAGQIIIHEHVAVIDLALVCMLGGPIGGSEFIAITFTSESRSPSFMGNSTSFR